VKQEPEIVTPVVATASMKLTEASVAQWYRIDKLDGPESDCRRLLDLGFTPGERVALVRTTPLGDPLVVVVRGTQIALRKREAAWILIQ
jgi:ferrous iron transport protein A